MEPLRPSDPRTVGPWQLQSRIGSGGMGVVFMAQRGTQLAALKVVRDSYLDTSDARARFKREVNILRQVSGRFVAAIIDADMDADPAWIASEFVDGVDLKAHMEVHGAFESAQWELLAGSLLLALAAVHAAKVVHRDIKPANILLSRDGPKLIDFGIAHTGDNTVLTTTGLAIGSPAWMAPEQVQAKAVGPAADVFCAGSVLLFAATGRAPWGSGSIAEVMGQIAVAEPDLSGLTARQQQLLRGMLEKDPARRPSAAQAAQLLTDTTSAAGATQVVAAGWGETAVVKVPNVLVNGQGTHTFADGTSYTGEFKDGKRNGQGTLTWPDGNKYTGECKDDKFNGLGTFLFANGDKYSGEYQDDVKYGQGTMTYANGGKYTGAWVHDERNGQGTYSYADGRQYTGKFKDGKFDGQGTYTYADGSKYTGWWKDGVFIGKGEVARQGRWVWLVAIIVLVLFSYATFRYLNRVEYVGEQRDGLAEGTGTRTWPDGSRYSGEFKADMRHGQGYIKWSNGSEYGGAWKFDIRNGYGIFTRPEGATYTGEFKDDKYNGQGTYTWPNGVTYTGAWVDDKRNGQGTETYADGDKYTGEFKDDKRNGQGTYTSASGTTWTGAWVNGELVW